MAILSPCGWGNLGDSAIVESVIAAVRRRMPAFTIAGLTLNPTDTAQRHGIPAFTCSGFDREHYGVTEGVPFADPERMAPIGDSPEAESNRLKELLRRASSLPVLRTVRRTGRVIQKDLNHRRLLRPYTRRLRWIVVAGGGQLDDFWGGSFGHPYVLWRWARCARDIGARYVVLSVGTGSLSTPLARFFVRQALELADYRSFRDEKSRTLVEDRLVEDDPVVPDLAYGLPVESFQRLSPSSATTRAIGFSPIAYCDPRTWPIADKRRYDSYLERITAVGIAMLERGYSLILYGTDGPDLNSVADLRAALVQRVPIALAARIQTPVVRTHDDLLNALAGVEMVVTSRLHGVTLPHLLSIPVLALSYERKVANLMDAMRQREYCLSIDDFTMNDAVGRVSAIAERRSALSGDIAARVSGYRMKVEAQYDSLFGQYESRNGGGTA